MKNTSSFKREGYLLENYHYFHLRDTAGQERSFHFHEFDKLVILIAGKVDYTVEDITYELQPWDVLFVKHHAIHRALIDRSEPYDRVIIYFDRKYFDSLFPTASLFYCFDRTEGSGRCRLTISDEERELLKTYLKSYEAENSFDDSASEAMKAATLTQLLILLNRVSPENSIGSQLPPVPDTKVQQTLSYINENLSADLSVDTLAEKVFLSKYHFMRLFKTQTGASVHAYIRQKRLLYAARLIREGTPAGQAASESGFRDYSAFSRAFRESFGSSPGKLK